MAVERERRAIIIDVDSNIDYVVYKDLSDIEKYVGEKPDFFKKDEVSMVNRVPIPYVCARNPETTDRQNMFASTLCKERVYGTVVILGVDEKGSVQGLEYLDKEDKNRNLVMATCQYADVFRYVKNLRDNIKETGLLDIADGLSKLEAEFNEKLAEQKGIEQ